MNVVVNIEYIKWICRRDMWCLLFLEILAEKLGRTSD